MGGPGESRRADVERDGAAPLAGLPRAALLIFALDAGTIRRPVAYRLIGGTTMYIGLGGLIILIIILVLIF